MSSSRTESAELPVLTGRQASVLRAVVASYVGAGGPIGSGTIAHLLATPLSPQQGRASLLVFFLATSIASAVSLATAGLLGAFLAIPVAIGFPLIVAGSRLGEALLQRGAGRGHRSLSILLLCAVAVTSVVQAVSDLLGHPL